MSRNGSYDTSDMLNSSFYSSTSINTLDHAKTFRNSLILADLEEPGCGNATGQTRQQSEDTEEEEIELPDAKYKETATIKMSTSPSLSALAGILSEKSRQANEKLRSSELFSSATIEEEEDAPELVSERVRDNVTVPTAGGTSPNLFQLNDNEEVYYPGSNTSDNLVPMQPDFLSSPKPAREDYALFPQRAKEDQLLIAKQRAPEVRQPTDDRQAREDYETFPQHTREDQLPVAQQKPSKVYEPADADLHQAVDPQPKTQRTVSATLPAEQNQQGRKRKNFFSFLKRRHSTDVLTTKSNSGIPSSVTFSPSNSSSPSVSAPAPERITKKSLSSSNIFSTFRKNREPKRENELQQQEHKTPKKEPVTDHSHIERDGNQEVIVGKPLPKKGKSDISQRKPTPLHYEHLQNAAEETAEATQPPVEAVLSAPKDDTLDSLTAKLDTGEVLFPRSLDKQEVDSIVSIERSRSTKSNKRSSVASHRRSLTETLSANAQNEGMFVMEASSVVLSTPDLSKSPASSILRNGKFDSAELASNNSILLEDQSEQALFENSSQKQFLVSESSQNRLSLASIEERLNELTVDSQDDHNTTEDQIGARTLNDDPEFMSDIMEFASIINFGEGIDFDFDSKTNVLEPEIATLRPLAGIPSVVPKAENLVDEQEDTGSGLGITYGNEGHEDQAYHQESAPILRNEDDEFENEDFNTLGETSQQSPRLKAFMPEFEANRPLSMSFRGLKAPSFNASVTGSSATDSILRADRKSLVSSERRHLNCVNFSSRIILYETYGEEEYDRKPDIATCNQLTPQLAQLIKAELNELKSDMEVHEESRCYTHFF